MGIDSQSANSSEFEKTIAGSVCMAAYMNAPLAVTLKVSRDWPDLLKVSVRYDDPRGGAEPVFVHRFTLSVRQLADGRTNRMFSRDGHIYPLPGRKVGIEAQTWHWSREVQVSRDDVDDFLAELALYLAD